MLGDGYNGRVSAPDFIAIGHVTLDRFEDDKSGEMRVIPGMIATVDISNGERTVLEYLLKPVLKIRDQALREAR